MEQLEVIADRVEMPRCTIAGCTTHTSEPVSVEPEDEKNTATKDKTETLSCQSRSPGLPIQVLWVRKAYVETDHSRKK